jgi:hypothetical protein
VINNDQRFRATLDRVVRLEAQVMEEAMTAKKLPRTDSIQKLAKFGILTT